MKIYGQLSMTASRNVVRPIPWMAFFLVCFILVIIQAHRLFFEGVDICDVGNQLAKQQAVFVFHELKGATGMTLISDLAGGAWLSFFPSGGLLWMRFGGVVLIALSAGVSFLILSNYFEVPAAAFAVFAATSSIAIIAPYGVLVHYYTVPGFFLSLSLFSASLAIRVRETSSGRHLLFWFFSGCLFGLAVFSRLPLAVLLPFLCIAWVAEILLAYRSKRDVKLGSFLAFFGGFATVVATVFSALAAYNLFSDYLGSIRFCFSSEDCNDLYEYRLRTLFPKYLIRGAKAITLAGGAVAIGWALRRWISLRRSLLPYIIIGTIACCCLMLATNGPVQSIQRFREMLVGFVAIGAIIALVVGARQNRVFILLLVTGLFITLSMAFGSTLGLQPAVWGMFFSLPAAILVPDLLQHIARPSGVSLVKGGLVWPLGGTFCLLAVVCSLLPSRMTWEPQGSTMRTGKPVELYAHDRLRGTRGEAADVSAINQLLKHLDEVVHPADNCLFFNHMGLFYWLTQSRCAFDSPVMYHSREGVVECQLDKMEHFRSFPKIAVLGRPRQDSLSAIEVRRDFETVSHFFASRDYQVSFTNRMFIVYSQTLTQPPATN